MRMSFYFSYNVLPVGHVESGAIVPLYHKISNIIYCALWLSRDISIAAQSDGIQRYQKYHSK